MTSLEMLNSYFSGLIDEDYSTSSGFFARKMATVGTKTSCNISDRSQTSCNRLFSALSQCSAKYSIFTYLKIKSDTLIFTQVEVKVATD